MKLDSDSTGSISASSTEEEVPASAGIDGSTPPLIPVPPPRLSPSGAGTFTQCPRRWKFRYIDRLEDPPGEDALAGSFAHRVLELLLQRQPEQRTIDEARLIARTEWPETEALSDYQALEHNEKESRRFRWKAWTAIEGLWDLEDPAEVKVRATEQDVEAELGGVPFRGIVDRIEEEGDGLIVTDYKSGKAPSPRFRRSRLDQVLLYAAAVEASTGEMPVRARLLYLGQRTIGMDVNREEIETVTEKLSDTWANINTACADDEFEPRTGPLCGWCPYVSMCPQGTAEVAKRANRKAAREAELLAMAS
ncbi:MAG: PD-(D/E)XK nuclease family protein [Acidimicrobiaceae bacterium]|nr:PD-(D/E)XK nuclease family protein [Acidimicrobiaceae bacterium]MXW74542.1 PD-(D/E)XK nuclease family protein [Acidimicrobiaceae bacterium]MYC41480.1 PD-(D/E)XK nuclease family protein [Acidimicrobiaceae bacterium]MYD06908.1 PD-(D/E)XK nuclease family protein [Acidimicrobiaceae bacterium]MYI58993.1 PD-(D/E)XK nuclease family protein [Acidimicrobiaceae bacterium]